MAEDIVRFYIADLDITRLFLWEIEQSISRLATEGHPEAENLYRALRRWNANLGEPPTRKPSAK